MRPFCLLGVLSYHVQDSFMVNDAALVLDGSLLADESFKSFRGRFAPILTSLFSNIQHNTLSNPRKLMKQELSMSKLMSDNKMGRKRKDSSYFRRGCLVSFCDFRVSSRKPRMSFFIDQK